MAGSVDGPSDTPLPPGNYVDAHTTVKVRLEVAVPLATPEDIATKPNLPTSIEVTVQVLKECRAGSRFLLYSLSDVHFSVPLGGWCTSWTKGTGLSPSLCLISYQRSTLKALTLIA